MPKYNCSGVKVDLIVKIDFRSKLIQGQIWAHVKTDPVSKLSSDEIWSQIKFDTKSKMGAVKMMSGQNLIWTKLISDESLSQDKIWFNARIDLQPLVKCCNAAKDREGGQGGTEEVVK